MAIEKIYNGPTVPEEDGMRTDAGKGSYEWWYFDSEGENGVKTSVVLLTKSFTNEVDKESHPTTWLDYAIPGEEPQRITLYENEGAKFRGDSRKCNVKVKDCYARRNDQTGEYEVHFENDDCTVVFDFVITPLCAMWRPGDGYFRFDANPEEYFAWFVAVPSGTTRGTLTVNGKSYDLKGTGYHDHNWGNITPLKVFDHWYWCRAAVEDYTVISCDLIGSKRNNYQRIPVFFINNNVTHEILSDESPVKITRGDTYIHEETGKFMDNRLTFEQTAGDTKWTVEYHREKDILAQNLVSGPMSIIVKHKGLKPTYVRPVGTVTLTKENADGKETHMNDGLWEQMGFGNLKEAIING